MGFLFKMWSLRSGEVSTVGSSTITITYLKHRNLFVATFYCAEVLGITTLAYVFFDDLVRFSNVERILVPSTDIIVRVFALPFRLLVVRCTTLVYGSSFWVLL